MAGLAHKEYTWFAEGPEDYEAESNDATHSNIGALPNFHPMLYNTVQDWTKNYYDDSLMNRMKDPGAGAFSYLSDTVTASRNIDAGHEIFANYGEDWLDSPNRQALYADVARKFNYILAEKIIHRFENECLDDSCLLAVSNIVEMFDKRTASVLPRSKSQLTQILSMKNLSEDYSTPINLALRSLPERSIEWIETNGRCLDNLVPKVSTIPQAGHGAFAQRFIPKGYLVVPAPALQIMKTKILGRRVDGVIYHQLMLNYCFGHDQSSILLYPVSNANLVNHCSERIDFGGSCGNGIGPNAKIQWDTEPTSVKWQQMSVEELHEQVKDGKRGLTFEIVATSDIQPGDEVFIDYGIAWEEAWNDHLKSWNPPEPQSKYSNYTSITKLRNDLDIRTAAELEVNPYPDNVKLSCLYGELLVKREESNAPSNWEELSDAEIMHISKPGGMYTRNSPLFEDDDYYWKYEPCRIYFYENQNYVMVGIFPSRSEPSPPLFYTGYPIKSVKLSSKPYTSDVHLPNAFRHSIGFPDEIFPNQWRNKI